MKGSGSTVKKVTFFSSRKWCTTSSEKIFRAYQLSVILATALLCTCVIIDTRIYFLESEVARYFIAKI